MKIKTFLLFFMVLVFTCAFTLPANAREIPPQDSSIDYSVGLEFSYNRANILMGEDDLENSMTFNYLALEVDAALLDYLTVGVVAGYNTNYFNDPVDFYDLPLSLRINDERYKSMLLGLRVKSDFFSWKEFSLAAGGEYLYFKLFKEEMLIQLPIVTGAATLKNSLYQVILELMVQYDGFTGLTIFAGPQWNLLKGKFTVSEDLEDLQDVQTLTYKLKNAMGIAAGINFEAGSHFDINAKISMFAKKSFSVEVFYIF